MFLLLVLAAADPMDGRARREARELIVEYFAPGTTDERREAIAEALAAHDPVTRSDIRHFQPVVLEAATQGARHDGQETTRIDGNEVVVRAPDSARQRPTPLFIGLHGRGGSGPQAADALGNPAPDMITVFPTCPSEEPAGWNAEESELFVLEILRTLKRTYRVDTSHVYIAGHSMGGFGTWSIAGRHADLFAAAASGAGGTYGGGVVPNYRNTPLYLFHSTDDTVVPVQSDQQAAQQLERLQGEFGGYDFVYREYTNIGHGFPPDGWGPIFEWMTERTRNPMPDVIVWEPSREYKTAMYWLEVDGRAGQVVARREGNRFSVTGASDIAILLNDRLVEWDEPVTLEVDGRVVAEGEPEYSLEVLVESVYRWLDPELIYYGRLRAPGR